LWRDDISTALRSGHWTAEKYRVEALLGNFPSGFFPQLSFPKGAPQAMPVAYAFKDPTRGIRVLK
jgi:hypothetical protein